MPTRTALPSPSRRACFPGLLALAGWGLAPPAWALAKPSGPVLLSVVGRVTLTNAFERADFDRAMLEALPQHSFSTATPWYNQARKFSGPLLRDVLSAAGAQGERLLAIALNNYKVEIPVADTRQFRMLLATKLDDKPMAVRDKGPLFIVYPYSDSAELRSERYYVRSAWQLRTLEVK